MATAIATVLGSVAFGLTSSTEGTTAPTTYNIFGDATPDVPAAEDDQSVELGVQFTASSPGWVTGLRYYKGPGNGGRHKGTLWGPDGESLAEETFSWTGDTGWQDVDLSKPVRLKPGETYTASYSAPQGHYAADVQALSPAKPTSKSALTATQGVYSYGDGMPRSSWRNINYYVDVQFSTVSPSEPSATTTRTPSPTTTGSGTTTTSTSTTASPTKSSTTTRSSGTSSTTTGTATPTAPGAWPDASNTGVSGCPTLQKVTTGGQVMLDDDNATYENKEFADPTVITVHGRNVTIRCVKFNGTGWFGIDNTDRGTSSVTVDRVDINCQNQVQVIGMLLHHATVTRANVYNCDHMINAGGDDLTITDSYCHALTDKPVVHADCIQSLGGNTGLRIEHNSLWSRDTSDILLGQEGGEAKDVVIHGNRLMSEGSPPPAYLLYLTGTNTVVTDNRFTRRYSYGACTHNNSYSYTWSGNVWDDDGSAIKSC